MRLTLPKSIARFGDIEIRGLQQVLELEAHETTPGHKTTSSCGHDRPHEDTQAVFNTDLQAVQARTAIVVPCKYESIARMRGVWAAIPANNLIIVVSGSTAEAYAEERDAFRTFCAVTRRSGICVHQSDPQLAAALRYVGMKALLDEETGLVHRGKGEGMVIGTMLAAIAQGPTRQNDIVAFEATDSQRGSTVCNDDDMETENTANTTTRCDDGSSCVTTRGRAPMECSKSETASTLCSTNSVEVQSHRKLTELLGYYRYIGFVDADNYVPGSVQEYCKAFSAGLALADTEDAMVRINWPAKPKVRDGRLEFQPSGRCSQIVNRCLNRLLRGLDARAAGGDDEEEEEDETDEGVDKRGANPICTGNAGEHAMSMSLALKLRLANGYAIEPFHFLDMFERLAGDSSVSATNGIGQEEKLMRVVDNSGLTGPPPFTSISPISSPLLPSGIRPPALVSLQKTVPSRPRFTPSSRSSSSGSLDDQSPLPSPISLSPAKEAANQDSTDITPPASPILPSSETVPAKVQIIQIRTLSAHFHDNKGEVHVVRMWQQGLSAIYHSPLAAPLTRFRNGLRTAIFAGDCSVSKLIDDLPTPPSSKCASAAVTPPDVSLEEEDRGINGAAVEAAASWHPERCRIYPAPGSVDLVAFQDRLEGDHGSLWWNVGNRNVDSRLVHGP